MCFMRVIIFFDILEDDIKDSLKVLVCFWVVSISLGISSVHPAHSFLWYCFSPPRVGWFGWIFHSRNARSGWLIAAGSCSGVRCPPPSTWAAELIGRLHSDIYGTKADKSYRHVPLTPRTYSGLIVYALEAYTPSGKIVRCPWKLYLLLQPRKLICGRRGEGWWVGGLGEANTYSLPADGFTHSFPSSHSRCLYLLVPGLPRWKQILLSCHSSSYFLSLSPSSAASTTTPSFLF